MRTTFYIELNMKTCEGFECFGCFDVGDDRGFALDLFSKLRGEQPEGYPGVLHMDLVEKYRGLPIGMRVISCSMEELGANVKTITRELFKRLALDASKVLE